MYEPSNSRIPNYGSSPCEPRRAELCRTVCRATLLPAKSFLLSPLDPLRPSSVLLSSDPNSRTWTFICNPQTPSPWHPSLSLIQTGTIPVALPTALGMMAAPSHSAPACMMSKSRCHRHPVRSTLSTTLSSRVHRQPTTPEHRQPTTPEHRQHTTLDPIVSVACV